VRSYENVIKRIRKITKCDKNLMNERNKVWKKRGHEKVFLMTLGTRIRLKEKEQNFFFNECSRYNTIYELRRTSSTVDCTYVPMVCRDKVIKS
jgi:hypothetical protein